MADIELLVKVPKDYYETLQTFSDNHLGSCLGSSERFIKHGIPLPTGHEGYGGKEMKKSTEHQIHEFAEQIYNIGFEDGYIDGKGQKWTDDQLKAESEMYAKGLNDAWECARKLVASRTIEEWDSLNEYMDVESCIDAFKKYSASEAIEKIKEYEAKQEQSETSYETHCKIGHSAGIDIPKASEISIGDQIKFPIDAKIYTATAVKEETCGGVLFVFDEIVGESPMDDMQSFLNKFYQKLPEMLRGRMRENNLRLLDASEVFYKNVPDEWDWLDKNTPVKVENPSIPWFREESHRAIGADWWLSSASAPPDFTYVDHYGDADDDYGLCPAGVRPAFTIY